MKNQVTNKNFSQKESFLIPPTYLKSTEEKEEFPKETKKIQNFQSVIIKLQEENHFLTLKNQYKIENDLKSILNMCHISKLEYTKSITFIIEMLNKQYHCIEVYQLNNKIQFFIVIEKKFFKIVEYLFEKYLLEEFNKENFLIVLEFTLLDKFILKKGCLEDLQQQIGLGLNSETFKKYKENQQTQAILFEQSKLASMGEMIGNIAHQWRQPLSVISTASTGLMFQLEYGLEIEKNNMLEVLGKINENTQYLSKTIDDFRNFIKQENPKEHYRLVDIIEKTISLVKPALADKHIKLVVGNIPDCLLDGHPNEVIQSLINIINNGKDAIVEHEKEKYIFIEGKMSKEDKVCVEIRDCGGGIPQEIMDKIFEPYFTTKHQAQGTGIGLYMTRQIIVENNNGMIEVENKSFEFEGLKCYGASFKVYFTILH